MQLVTLSFVDHDDTATLHMSGRQDHESDRGGGLDNPRGAEDEPETNKKDTEENRKQTGRGEPD